MSFLWVFPQQDRENYARVLEQELGVPPKIAELLALRGIHTFDDAKIFFRPEINSLYNPFLMKDMDIAAERVAQAIRNREKVLIYGDYDVDGTTATASMMLFLRKFGVETDYYIPHRFKEGYGINEDGLVYAAETGASLVISVDCGITAVEEAKTARKKGLDLIICDHHNVGEVLPDALAVLDPKRPDCPYPFDGLSGAGVAFKLIQGALEKLGLPARKAYEYLDLVAISIASDIVPIIDENRILMQAGLALLRRKPRTGIAALLDLIKLPKSDLNTTKIVFSVGPRINAAGRMGDATTALNLLLAEDKNDAKAFAHELESVNILRRKTDSKTLEEALGQIDESVDLNEASALVLFKEDWHLGVIGIVASRLVDLYHRPVVMLSEVEGVIKGSARSIRGFNIYNALRTCAPYLDQYGGHEFAAGLTLSDGRLNQFRAAMNEVADKALKEIEFKPELLVDTRLKLSSIDKKFWKLLSQFEPFGPSNLRPVFVSEGVQVVGTPLVVGNGHLKIKLKQGESGVFEAIGFNMHEYHPHVRNGKLFNIAYVIEENNWNGKRTLQLRLKDIQLG